MELRGALGHVRHHATVQLDEEQLRRQDRERQQAGHHGVPDPLAPGHVGQAHAQGGHRDTDEHAVVVAKEEADHSG